MCGSMVDIQSPTAEIRRGKKERTRNVGQCPWWPLCRIQVVPSVQHRKVWLTPPLLECCAVTLPRCGTRWNFQGCLKLANRSQPLAGRSSLCGETLLFNKFFSDCRYVPYLRRYSPIKFCDGVQMVIFLGPAFPVSRAQHISYLHPKFALRPHHVWKYGRHPISDGWD